MSDPTLAGDLPELQKIDPQKIGYQNVGAQKIGKGWFFGVIGLGVVIRLAFLLLAGDIQPYADEANYLYLALVWNRFSLYSGGLPYLWPPGYPFCLATMLSGFGLDGIFVLKLCQVILSGVIGGTVMLLASRLFSTRAARLAGLIWCFYLPLVGFTHYLWPETLFLCLFMPGFYLLVRWWQHTPRETAVPEKLVLAGVLIGFALLIKEVALWWCLLVAILIIIRDRAMSFRSSTGRAFVFLLAVSVVVVPWSLRNNEVYDRFAPVGATLGQNVFFGMNAYYLNFDYPGPAQEPAARENVTIRKMLTQSVSKPWKRSEALNIIDQSSENVRRGLSYALEHPSFMLGTRIKRMADWVSPMSFFVRHYGMDEGGYTDSALANPVFRKIAVTLALLLPVLVMAWAVGGIAFCLQGHTVRGLILWTLLYFATTGALIAGVSRYRISIEPILIVLAAAFILRDRNAVGNRMKAAVICVTGWVLLIGLWLINAMEVFVSGQCAW